IRILNSWNPEAPGTLIGRRAAGTPPRIVSLACRTAAHLSFGIPAEVTVPPGKAVISLVSEDLATSPELAQRALASAASFQPQIVLGVAPAVRFTVEEGEAPRVLSELHRKLIR